MPRLLPRCATLILCLTLSITPAIAIGSTLQGIVASARNLVMHWPDFSDYREYVEEFYAQRDFQPAWFHNGRPTSAAAAIIETLEHADAKGLNAVDYDSELLGEALRQGPAGDAAALDVALTVAVMRYISDLRVGRVDYKSQSNDFDIPDKRLHLPSFVDELSGAADIEQRLDSVEPGFPQYDRLITALARYQQLAADSRLAEKLDDADTIHPGEPYAQARQLAYKLHALGDLQSIPATADLYTQELARGVKHFQKRHGIDQDGVIGKGTFRELNTPLQKRVGQIILALERFRWLPNDFGQYPIIVNLPEFRARAFRRVGEQQYEQQLEMKVVVGKAYPRNQTPVFNKRMNHLVLAPYWNVPTSITRGELLPKLGKDPSYLQKHHYEIVDGEGNSYPYNSSSRSGLQGGKLRIRQKPGDHNSLGLVKFMFPNKYSVYMHGTPARSLFDRSKRDYSHGCIRLEDPLAMAEHITALDGQGDTWTRERLKKTMQGGVATTVKLDADIEVFVLYTTAIVPVDGEVHFYADVYGHDGKLAKALAGGYPYPWTR